MEILSRLFGPGDAARPGDEQSRVECRFAAVGHFKLRIGEQHISKRPDVIGYDEVYKIPTNHTDDVVPVTLDLLERASDRPFFRSVGFFETHREWFRPSSPKKATRKVTPPTKAAHKATNNPQKISPITLDNRRSAV